MKLSIPNVLGVLAALLVSVACSRKTSPGALSGDSVKTDSRGIVEGSRVTCVDGVCSGSTVVK